MSISSLGPTNSWVRASAGGTTPSPRSAFSQLPQDLNASHLSAAQSAFANAQNQLQPPAAAGTVTATTAGATAGTAAPGTGGAHAAFANLASDTRSQLVAGHGHHHGGHHAAGGAGAQDAWSQWLARLTQAAPGTATGTAKGATLSVKA